MAKPSFSFIWGLTYGKILDRLIIIAVHLLLCINHNAVDPLMVLLSSMLFFIWLLLQIIGFSASRVLDGNCLKGYMNPR